MHALYGNIIRAAWIVLGLVWFIGFLGRKRAAHVSNLEIQILASALLGVCFVCLFNPRLFALGRPVTPPTEAFALPGALLVLAGVAFAIWARLTLGGNWSGTLMSVQEDHQLVQRGPYALVRHPIYTGLAAAILGTALTIGTVASYVGIAAGLAGFLLRIHLEDRLMAEQFGEAHAAWRRRTKAFIPFVW